MPIDETKTYFLSLKTLAEFKQAAAEWHNLTVTPAENLKLLKAEGRSLLKFTPEKPTGINEHRWQFELYESENDTFKIEPGWMFGSVLNGLAGWGGMAACMLKFNGMDLLDESTKFPVDKSGTYYVYITIDHGGMSPAKPAGVFSIAPPPVEMDRTPIKNCPDIAALGWGMYRTETSTTGTAYIRIAKLFFQDGWKIEQYQQGSVKFYSQLSL